MCKGHTHRLLVCEPSRELFITDVNGKLKQDYTGLSGAYSGNYIHEDHRWYVNTGSFRKTYKIGIYSYAEVREYDPMEIGFAVARIRDGMVVGVDEIKFGRKENE